jgi:tetratricopeptide (TPR) repeat protein
MLVEQWLSELLAEGKLSRDAILFVNLGGFSLASTTSQEASPASALADLLGQLGVTGQELPGDIAARATLFRSLTADRSLVIFLDNALNEDQIRQMLPVSGPSMVIVTTRKDQLLGLPVRDGMWLQSIEVHRFDESDSIDLLSKGAGTILNKEQTAASAIARYCCGLPLALGIAAALVRSRQYTLAELAEVLALPDARLSTLDLGDDATDLLPVFSASYSRLSAAAQQAFRHLGVRLGQDIDDYAVYLMTGKTISQVGRIIRELQHVGLIEKGQSRFSLHDLLHAYAKQLSDEIDSEGLKSRVLTQLVDGYYGCVNYAFDLWNPANPMVDLEYVNKWKQADKAGLEVLGRYSDSAQWFETERANLLDLVQRASAMSSPPQNVAHLAFSMFYFLDIGGYWTEWEQVTQLGYRVAIQSDDIWAQARLLRNIARIKWVRVRDYSDSLRIDSSADSRIIQAQLGACEEAIRSYERSDTLYGACRPAHSLEAATVKRELADVYLEQARLDSSASFEQAIEAYLEARSIFEHHPHSENPVASLSVPMSVAYRYLGRHDEAQICLDTALAYASPADDRSAPVHKGTYSFALLREAELQVDQYRAGKDFRLERASDDVLAAYDKAIAAFHAHRYWLAEARTSARKGKFLASLGRNLEARQVWLGACVILTSHESEESRVVEAWIDELANGGSR